MESEHTGKESSLWKARIIATGIMLILALLGLIVTDVSQDESWNYWRIVVPIYALTSLVLSWYVRKKKGIPQGISIWQELLHWGSLLLAVYLVSVCVHIGLYGRFAAALQIVTLLALTTFIAGIYIDIAMIPIGILLGVFVSIAAFLEVYLYFIMIPVIIIALFIVLLMVKKRKKRAL